MGIVSLISLWFIPVLIGFILIYGTIKKVPAYEKFVDGGKEGIKIAVSLIPYLVGMLVAISVFRASGALDFFMELIRPALEAIGVPPEIAPLAIIRPISGSASLGIMSDIIAHTGRTLLSAGLHPRCKEARIRLLYFDGLFWGRGHKKMGDALKSASWQTLSA